MNSKLKKLLFILVAFSFLFVSSCSLFEEEDDKEPSTQIESVKELTANVSTLGVVTLTWRPVPNAKVYEIYRRVVDETSWEKIGLADDPKYKDMKSSSNPLDTKVYEYGIVTVYDIDRVGERYNMDSYISSPLEVNLKAVTFPAKGSQLPAPANLVLTQNFKSLVLHWDEVEYAKNYTVYYRDTQLHDGTREFHYTAATSGNTENLFLNITSDFTGTEELVFYVVANYEDNYLLQSDRSTASAATVPVIGVTDITTLTVNGFKTSIQVAWNKIGTADSYKVYRSTDNFTSATALTTAATDFYIQDNGGTMQVVFEDTTAVANTEYKYKVIAVEGTLEGELSSATASAAVKIESDKFTISNPADVAATDGTFNNKVVISWTKVDNADQYIIYRKYENIENKTINYEVLVAATTFTNMVDDDSKLYYEDTTTSAGKAGDPISYTYKVIAYNSTQKVRGVFDSVSEPGNEDTGYVNHDLTEKKAIATPSVTVTNADSEIQLIWTKAEETVTYDAGNTTKTTTVVPQTYTVYYAAEKVDVDTEDGGVGRTPNLQVLVSGLTESDTALTLLNDTYTLDVNQLTGVTLDEGVEYIFEVQAVNTTENLVSEVDTTTIERGMMLELDAITTTFTNVTSSNDVTVATGDEIVFPVTSGVTYIVYRSATNPDTASTWYSGGTFVQTVTADSTTTITTIPVDQYVWIVANATKDGVTFRSHTSATQNVTN